MTNGKMRRYYEGLANRMRSELETISDQMSHSGEKGRNNEQVLARYLRDHLPKKYDLSTGKVVAADGSESAQMDIIIHDRIGSPAFIDGDAWSLVPVETVFGCISVKTTLNATQLKDAAEQIESVRKLPRLAAVDYSSGAPMPLECDQLLRPRGFIFAYKSEWKDVQGLVDAFKATVSPMDDTLRPNCVCVLGQGLVLRLPYSVEMAIFPEFSFLHFFVLMVHALNAMRIPQVNLEAYFENYPQ